MILGSVALILGFLLFLYSENKGLYSSDIEIYDRYVAEIASLNNDYLTVEGEIGELASDSKIDLQSTDLINDKHLEAIDILESIINANEQILLLEVSEEEYTIAKRNIQSSESLVKSHEISIEQLASLRNVLSYNQEQISAIKCYESINTDESSSNIEKAVRSCNEKLDNTIALLGVSTNYPETKKYHNEIKNYWDLTIRFNQAVEQQNKIQAEELREELNISSERIQVYILSSEEELVRDGLQN